MNNKFDYSLYSNISIKSKSFWEQIGAKKTTDTMENVGR